MSTSLMDLKPPDRGIGYRSEGPIRILYIIDSLWGTGGAELSLLRLVKHLPRERFHCHIVTLNSNEVARPFREKFPCPVHHWQVNNLYDIPTFRVGLQIRRLVKQEKIDVVHTFFETSDLWAGPIAKMSGARVLISSRRDMGILRQFKHRIGYRLVRGFYDQVQAVSESVRQYAIKTDRLDPKCTLVVHNGVDSNVEASADEIESMRRTLALPPDTPVVSCVANWRHVKGIDILIRAAALVNRRVPVRFVLAGQFGYSADAQTFTAEAQQLNQRLGGEQWMQFLGPSNQVPALLKLSDIFVLPSRSEGLSNALLEAMLSSLPCVATRVGGNPEAVEDGKTGFLVPSEDPEALADRIVELVRNPEMRRAMGDASRARALKQFTTESMLATVIASYEELLSAASAPSLARGNGRQRD